MQAGRAFRARLRRRHGQQGFVLLAWLIVVGIFAAASMMVVTRLSDTLQRENEQALLLAGDQIAGAIEAYRQASAGSARKHPAELDELLEDRRAFGTVRHLRQVPRDPMTRGAPWGLIRAADGGIAGVYSGSLAQPMLRMTARLQHVDLQPATRYADWRFVPREGTR